jgi:hypothetical protein
MMLVRTMSAVGKSVYCDIITAAFREHTVSRAEHTDLILSVIFMDSSD